MILAIDTSTPRIGLALHTGEALLATLTLSTGRHHTRTLAPLLGMALERLEAAPKDITAVAVALGPGSFTGLRVGLAFAKGIATALAVPILGVSTFEALAAAVPLREGYRWLVTALPAGRKRLAVGWYIANDGRWQSHGAPEVLTADELAARIRRPTVICGELRAEERARLARKWKNALLLSPANCANRSAYIAELAWSRLQRGEEDNLSSLAPLYLHTGTPIPA